MAISDSYLEEKAREFYDLERLWRDARRLPLLQKFQVKLFSCGVKEIEAEKNN
jgi:hypothetical protein